MTVVSSVEGMSSFLSIRVRLSVSLSIHSGRTFASGVKWNEHDAAGYQNVEDIMIRFGMKCFSTCLFGFYERATKYVVAEAEIASRAMGTSTETTPKTAPTSGTTADAPNEDAGTPPSTAPSRPLASERPLNEEFKTLLELLPDAARRDCLAELHAMPNISFEREMNIAYAHSRLIAIMPGSPLNSQSFLHKYMPKVRGEKNPWHIALFGNQESEGSDSEEDDTAGAPAAVPIVGPADAFVDAPPAASTTAPPAASTAAPTAAPATASPAAPIVDPAPVETSTAVNVTSPTPAAVEVFPNPAPTPLNISDPPSLANVDDSTPTVSADDKFIAPLTEMHVDDELRDDVDTLHWDQVDKSKFWPELKQAFDAFRRGSAWGTVWISLIDSLLVFEEMAGFVDDGKTKLATDHRPSVVADFMRLRRNWAKKWPVGDLNDFVPSFWKWWRSLQPTTRIHEDRLIKPDFVNWDGLQDKSGRNGITLVIGVLLWWGEAVSDLTDVAGSAQRENWVLAVTDVTWALDNMIRNATFRKVSKTASASTSVKRTSTEADVDKENDPVAKASTDSLKRFSKLM